jgi:hypothetical protein
MKTGWKEVARLGIQGARYPHLLVDTYGWCLRLGLTKQPEGRQVFLELARSAHRPERTPHSPSDGHKPGDSRT